MKIRNEVKIGLVTIVALALGYVGINFLKGINLFKADNQYYLRLTELSGANVATPVMISGYKVGSVREVQFDYSEARGYSALLTLALDPGVRIPHGSRIRVKTNVLSGAELMVQSDSVTSGFYAAGDTLPAQPSSPDIISMASEEILPAVMDLLPELSRTLTRLGDIVASPAIDSSLRNLQASTEQMQSLMARLNRSVAVIPEVMNNVQQVSASMAIAGRNVENIRLDSLVHNLNVTTENLRLATAQLKSKDNTAGLLLNDPSLYNRIDSLMASANALMVDLKAHPKRYVHFSLF